MPGNKLTFWPIDLAFDRLCDRLAAVMNSYLQPREELRSYALAGARQNVLNVSYRRVAGLAQGVFSEIRLLAFLLRNGARTSSWDFILFRVAGWDPRRSCLFRLRSTAGSEHATTQGRER